MTGDWRTSLIAVLVFVAFLANFVVDLLSGKPVDYNMVIQAVITLLIALGLWKAADKANVKK